MKNTFELTARSLTLSIPKALMAVLALVILSCNSQASPPPLGLWVWQSDTSSHELQLSIRQNQEGWLLQVNGNEVTGNEIVMTKTGSQIELAGPNGQTFSGSLSDDQLMISGYWQQPSTSLGYSNMVTKVELKKGQDASWHGRVTEQARPFHIFLDIFGDKDNGFRAVIRNPERNEIMRATAFDMKSDSPGQWRLVAKRGSRIIEVPVKKLGEESLQITHSRFIKPITLKPANLEQKKPYYSRYKQEPNRGYTMPKQLNDGWTPVSAQQAGFDATTLSALADRLTSANPRDARPNLIHSMLIAHKGQLLFEEYFFGQDENTAHDTRSLAKVFGSVMLGAMQTRGEQVDPQITPLEEVLQRRGKHLQNPAKRKITLAHLLTYSSGLDCNITSRTSLGEEDTMWSQQQEADFWLYTAQLPLLHPPGKRYAYCSGSANLVGATIRHNMAMPVFDAFHTLIAKPLQFAPYHWNLMPNGEGYLGGGVYMRPRDILKLGAVYANGGKWHDKHIVSKAWIEESTSTKLPITAETTGLSEQDFQNNYFGGGQAYIWRTDKVKTPFGDYASYEATGNGGQILLVVPELSLSVVMTGGNYSMGSIWGKWRNELVGGYVVPAVVGKIKKR